MNIRNQIGVAAARREDLGGAIQETASLTVVKRSTADDEPANTSLEAYHMQIGDALKSQIVEKLYGEIRRDAVVIVGRLSSIYHSDPIVREAALDEITQKLDRLIRAGENDA